MSLFIGACLQITKKGVVIIKGYSWVGKPSPELGELFTQYHKMFNEHFPHYMYDTYKEIQEALEECIKTNRPVDILNLFSEID